MEIEQQLPGQPEEAREAQQEEEQLEGEEEEEEGEVPDVTELLHSRAAYMAMQGVEFRLQLEHAGFLKLNHGLSSLHHRMLIRLAELQELSGLPLLTRRAFQTAEGAALEIAEELLRLAEQLENEQEQANAQETLQVAQDLYNQVEAHRTARRQAGNLLPGSSEDHPMILGLHWNQSYALTGIRAGRGWVRFHQLAAAIQLTWSAQYLVDSDNPGVFPGRMLHFPAISADMTERFGAVPCVVSHKRALPNGLTGYNGNPLDVCITTDAVNGWQGGQHFFLAVIAYGWELQAERQDKMRVYHAPGMPAHGVWEAPPPPFDNLQKLLSNQQWCSVADNCNQYLVESTSTSVYSGPMPRRFLCIARGYAELRCRLASLAAALAAQGAPGGVGAAE